MSAPSRPSTWTALWCSDGISLSRLRELQARMKTQAGSRDSPIPLHATIPTPSAGHFSPPRRGRTTRFAQNPAFCSSGQYVSDATVAPSRERGSKPIEETGLYWDGASLPHGSVDRNGALARSVIWNTSRSLTGAWIETCTAKRSTRLGRSLPHGSVDRNSGGRTSAYMLFVAPSRERGSKPVRPPGARLAARSLPHGSVDRNKDDGRYKRKDASRSLTGAWIETRPAQRRATTCRVAPSRERGSKPARAGRVLEIVGRRSLTGAWIETRGHQHNGACKNSRSLTGAWIETSLAPLRRPQIWVAPSRERGSKLRVGQKPGTGDGSLPHGSVDRNSKYTDGRFDRSHVAPSRERGSKLHRGRVFRGPRLSLPHGSVDRNDDVQPDGSSRKSRSLTGAWIET